MDNSLNRMVSKGPSDKVRCEQNLESREDMNQEVSGERTFWKERKPSMKSFRRKFKISRLADSRNNKEASVVEE